MANTEYKSILDNRELTALSSLISSEDDGVKFINIDKTAKTPLGRALSPTAPIHLKTPFGRVGTIRGFMDAICIEGYDPKYLARAVLTREEMAQIPKKRLDVPNYWACVAYITCERVFNDNEVQKMMKENDLPYECFRGAKKNMLYGSEVWTAQTNRWLSKYIGILRKITEMIKSDSFTKENAEAFVNACKDDPSKEIFDSISLALPKPVKTENA